MNRRSEDLRGALALVTGAATGIGRATALRLAMEGARVICVDIDDAGARRTAYDCGDVSLAFQVDVSDADAMAALAERVHSEHGTVDILVNNAGVGMSGHLEEMTLADWEWIRSINLDGVLHGCRLFAPPMLERGSGHIVNVSSGLGYTPRATEPAYVTTKAAVLALSRSLHADWEPRGVRVSAVCPGVVNTDIIEHTAFVGSQAAARESGQKLFSRGHPPDKVARAIVETIGSTRVIVPVGVESWAGWLLSRFGPLWLQERVARQDVTTLAPGAAPARKPVGDPFTVATDDGARISGFVAGTGPAVVLSHCWTGTHHVWDDVIDLLLEAGMCVIAYDHRGHGGSSTGSQPPSLERLAKDLLAVLEETGCADAVLVGHSLGSMTVQRLALDHPEAVRRHVSAIVLVGTSARGVASWRVRWPSQRIVGSRVAQRVMSTRGGVPFARRAFGRKANAMHVDVTREMFAATDIASRVALLASMQSMDLRGLARTHVPVTVLAAERDRLTPPVRGREVAERLGATFEVLPHVGHMIPMEAPQAVVDAITALAARTHDARR